MIKNEEELLKMGKVEGKEGQRVDFREQKPSVLTAIGGRYVSESVIFRLLLRWVLHLQANYRRGWQMQG